MKKSNTKKRILKKAAALFFEYGYAKASIRDIVRAVGITNSTIYIHFKNKDEILFSIIEDIGKTLLDELRTAIEKHDDPEKCLREMIFRQVCLIKEKRKEIKIYMEEQYQLPPPLRRKALKQHRQIYELYHTKISEVRDRGLLHAIDETVATFCIVSMINWSYRWFNVKGRLSIEEIAEHIIRVFFAGIFNKNATVTYE